MTLHLAERRGIPTPFGFDFRCAASVLIGQSVQPLPHRTANDTSTEQPNVGYDSIELR